MEKREYRIDYQWEEEPLLVLPLCVGGMLLSGELFGWLNSLEPGGLPSDQLAAIRIVYFGFLLIRFHRTRNNIRAIGAYLEGV